MENVETVIIGAGQAGLATAYHLRQRGRECVVLDRNQRIGDDWRQQWDSLRLYSPARYDGLPGHAVPRPTPWSFPGKDEVADYLEAYAARWDLPVRLGVRVDGCPRPRTTASSSPLTAGRSLRQRRGRDRHLRTGAVRSPTSPKDLDPSILQLHSSEYRRPGPAPRRPRPRRRRLPLRHRHRLRGGGHPADHPRRPRLRADPGPAGVAADPRRLPDVDVRVAARRSPVVRRWAARRWREIRFHGGPMLRVKRADLAERGVDPQRGPGRGRPRRAAGAGRRHRRSRRERGLGDRLPAGLRLDRPAGLRRGRLADASTAASSTTCPACSSAGLSFQYAFSSMLLGRRRPGRGVRRPPDRRARHRDPSSGERRGAPDRPAVIRAPARVVRPGGGIRDGHGRRPGAGSRGLRARRLGRRARHLVRHRRRRHGRR